MQNQESGLNQSFERRDRRYMMNVGEDECGVSQKFHEQVRDCPYLSSVNRKVLDFEREKCCCISLSKQNVYSCLVCGRYFQGRDKTSPAYKHSLKSGHHLYLCFRDEKFYCLPEDYQITATCLQDILHVMHPRFSLEDINEIDENRQAIAALDGLYLPGLVELQIRKEFDFFHTIILPLMRVLPVRNFFLNPERYLQCKSKLVLQFGELVRKIWNSRNFKRKVNPHEFVETFMSASKIKLVKRSKIYPVDYLCWFLNTLHEELRTTTGWSIIKQTFQGELQYTKVSGNRGDNGAEVTGTMPFWILTLDLPLLKKKKKKFPVVDISQLLEKFSGTEEIKVGSEYMRLRVSRLPHYFIFNIPRFEEHRGFLGKNTTRVNLQLRNFDLERIFQREAPADVGVGYYNLICNVTHEGDPNLGNYNIYLKRKSDNQWYSIQEGRVSLDRSTFVEREEQKWWRVQDIDLPVSINTERPLPKEKVKSASYILMYERQP